MQDHPGSVDGTTVTVFGGSDRLDRALGAQLEQRGCRTHVVSVPTGWLRTATHAVVRLDTVAGLDALKELAETPEPPSHVIAVCPEPAADAETRRLRDLCRACGAHHDVALILHPPLEAGTAAGQGDTAGLEVATNILAATLADEVVEHAAMVRPAFVAKAVRLGGPAH